jgi:hypothetical protein
MYWADGVAHRSSMEQQFKFANPFQFTCQYWLKLPEIYGSTWI